MYDWRWVYLGEVPKALTLSINPNWSPYTALSFLMKSATFAAAYSRTIDTESEQNFSKRGTIYSNIISGEYISRSLPNCCPIHYRILHFFWSFWNYSKTPIRPYLFSLLNTCMISAKCLIIPNFISSSRIIKLLLFYLKNISIILNRYFYVFS